LRFSGLGIPAGHAQVMLAKIQGMNMVSLEKTPGYPGSAHLE
jgi:hypothetical protein